MKYKQLQFHEIFGVISKCTNSYRIHQICTKSAPSDINFEIPNNTNSKYYSVEEYQKEKHLGNFNIFHTNVNGLGSKCDNIHEFLSSVSTKLDVLAITYHTISL